MAKLEYRKVKEVEIKDVNHGKRGRDTSWELLEDKLKGKRIKVVMQE